MKITTKREAKQARLLSPKMNNLRPAGAKTIVTLSGCAALLLAACDVKDPIYNTSHPGHGMVTLTTEWSGIGKGLTPPESYTVNAFLADTGNPAKGAAYSATLTGVTNKLDHLFEPGDYRFYVYNTPDKITVSGTTASVATEAVTPMESEDTPLGTRAADDPVHIISSAPGWLFTNTLETAIAADTEQELTASMQQQVRELALLITPSEGMTDEIADILGGLTGVAGTFDMESGTHGTPSQVVLSFSKITDGADAGKWSATLRLLGVTGGEQMLAGMIRFSDTSLDPLFLESDLSGALTQFNADKRTPLTLEGKAVETPDGSRVTITEWTPVNGD